MFPSLLNRMQYLVRWLCLLVGAGLVAALFVPLFAKMETPTIGLVFVIALSFFSLVFKIIGMDLPRLRSIGWSPWLIVLLLIPVVGVIVQILLFVMPPQFE